MNREELSMLGFENSKILEKNKREEESSENITRPSSNSALVNVIIPEKNIAN